MDKIKVYAYFISKDFFGLTTERSICEKLKIENKEISTLEKVSFERAVNWLNYNRKNR